MLLISSFIPDIYAFSDIPNPGIEPGSLALQAVFTL